MKFNWNIDKPQFVISDEERLEINNFKRELITDLDQYRETEKIELEEKIENIFNLTTILEVLEKERIETIHNLAFSTEYYKENCFYIDENGLVRITENEQLFFRFYHAFVEINKFHSRAIAQNIIRVRLIEFIAKILSTVDSREYFLPPLDFKPQQIEQTSYNHPIFKNAEFERFFNYSLNNRAKKINKLFVCYLYSYILHTLKGINVESKIYDFVIFWNKNYNKPPIPIYKEKKTGFVSWDHKSNDYITELEKLYDDFL